MNDGHAASEGDERVARTDFGRAFVGQAADTARKAFRDPALVIDEKGVGDLVTDVDFAIEGNLRRVLSEHFSTDAVLGEEGGGVVETKGFTWLIDPVDGTINFARGIGYFCISLTLLQNGHPIAAWIADPCLDEVFSATPDGRAFLGDTEIRVADTTDMVSAVIGIGFSRRHSPEKPAEVVGALTAADVEFRRLGAGALCLAHVAAGRLDAYLEPHMNPWDAMGGLYIARCAGAVIQPYAAEGELAAGGVVFAAAPGIARQLLTILPDPFSGTPPHLENDLRSAGEAATQVATSTLIGRRTR